MRKGRVTFLGQFKCSYFHGLITIKLARILRPLVVIIEQANSLSKSKYRAILYGGNHYIACEMESLRVGKYREQICRAKSIKLSKRTPIHSQPSRKSSNSTT